MHFITLLYSWLKSYVCFLCLDEIGDCWFKLASFSYASYALRDVVPVPHSSGYKWVLICMNSCLVFNKNTTVWTVGLPLGRTKIVWTGSARCIPMALWRMLSLAILRRVDNMSHPRSRMSSYESWDYSHANHNFCVPIVLLFFEFFPLFVWVLEKDPKWPNNTLK